MKNSSDKSHLSNHLIKGKKIGLVKSQWNTEITDKLYNGCYKTLESHGAKKKDIYTLEVPGSFELIFGAKKILNKAELDAVIVIGSIIKGETPHFEFICNSTFTTLSYFSIKKNKPVGNGIITCLNMKQAKLRASKKGKEATNAVLEIFKVV